MVFFISRTPIEKVEVRRAALRRNYGELATFRAILAKSSSGRCRFRRDGHCPAANHFMGDSHQVALSNIFLLVRESSDPPIDLC
jgi:hypothetical protein